MERTKDFKVIFKIVKNAIHKTDPYSLIKNGCPEDEFDSDILTIVGEIKNCNSIEKLSEVIANTFINSFEDIFTPSQFTETAQEIFSNLKKEELIEE